MSIIINEAMRKKRFGKYYKIPLVWSMYGYYWVEAENEEEAKALAMSAETPLPQDAYYLNESIEIDEDAEIVCEPCEDFNEFDKEVGV